MYLKNFDGACCPNLRAHRDNKLEHKSECIFFGYIALITATCILIEKLVDALLLEMF